MLCTLNKKINRIYPSEPLKIRKTALKQRSEKKLNDVNIFINSIINNNEMNNYVKNKNQKSKKKSKNYKMLTTILKSFDTIVIFATTSSSITLSVTVIGLIPVTISAATACELSIGIKLIYEIAKQKHKKFKIQYQNGQKTIKSFDELYGKNLQDKVFDKNENESLCNVLTKYLVETKNESFLKN